MFRIHTTTTVTLLLILILFLLPSCGTTDRINYLSYQSYPFNTHGLLSFDGTEYEILVTVRQAGDLRLQIVKPERLTGTVLSLSDGTTTLTYDSVTTVLNDGGYTTREGLLLASAIFSLSGNSYAGAGVTTEKGIKYSYASYTLPEGTVTVYMQSGLDRPDKIAATLNGHTLLFRFMNES